MSFSNPLPSGASGTNPSYTSVSGSRGTSSVGASAAIREVQEAMITFQPYQNPILVKLLTSKFGKKATGNQKFEWIYSSLLPRTDTVTLAGGAASEDNITVGDSTLYQVGTKFYVDTTGEVVIVDSIASSQIDVTKVGSGSITAGASVNVHFLGDDFEQGSSSATAKSVNKNFEYNYVEIKKKSVQETNSQRATVEYGPNDFDRNKMDRMSEFNLDVEASFLFGVRSSGTGVQNGSYTQFYAGGVYDSTASFISATYAFAGTVPSEDYFFKTFLRGAYSKGSNSKTLYAGSALRQAISDYSKVKQQTRTAEKEYGVSIDRVLHDFGILNVVWHPMLDGGLSGKGFLIDDKPGVMQYRYLAGNGENRDLNFYDYPHFEEQDSRKGEWKGEIGIQLEGNEYHALLQPSGA